MEIVTKVMEKSWKSHGILLVKMCTNPVLGDSHSPDLWLKTLGLYTVHLDSHLFSAGEMHPAGSSSSVSGNLRTAVDSRQFSLLEPPGTHMGLSSP